MWANPSSPHQQGRAARAALEQARLRIAAALGWQGPVIFTSGASKSLALAISHSVQPLVALSAVEHDAALRLAEGVDRIAVNAQGRVDVDAVGRNGLVAVQQVNSETGVMQPLRRISIAVREAGGLLLADCSAGSTARPARRRFRSDRRAQVRRAGGRRRAPGARSRATEARPAGRTRLSRRDREVLPACSASRPRWKRATPGWRTRRTCDCCWKQGIVEAGGEVIAPRAERIATISSCRVTSAVQLIRFDSDGISVSAGSACSSGSLKPSHVLKAMGLDDKAASEVIRVSIGRETSEADIHQPSSPHGAR